jgi:hypothetical protein
MTQALSIPCDQAMPPAPVAVAAGSGPTPPSANVVVAPQGRIITVVMTDDGVTVKEQVA